jgi:hypothetical protein
MVEVSTDTKIIFGIFVFLSMLTYFLGQAAMTQYATTPNLQKPICVVTSGGIDSILDNFACGINTLGVLLGLSGANTNISFLNVALFIPITVLVIYIGVRLLRGV